MTGSGATKGGLIMEMQIMELMNKMMPYMVPLVYAGAALVVIGIIAALMAFFSGSGRGLAHFAGILLILLGIFFLGCQVAGFFLGSPPSINFGDPSKFEFILYPFWQIGAVMLAVGILIRMCCAAARWRTRSA